MPAVNPRVLVWARETAGLSLEDAAQQIKLNAAGGKTGAERLKAIEDGQTVPTRSLLIRMAERYRRPLVALYLESPPTAGDRGQDFRRAPNAPPSDFDPRLDALLRDVRVRQRLARTLLEDEEVEPRKFVGSTSTDDGPASIAESISSTIDFDLTRFRGASDSRAAFSYLRERLESSGIFVVLLGNLGSYHTNISPEVFRGYAIADPVAPFIIVNENDADAAWSFTALHEAAHIWLGQTGISGFAHTRQVEQLCNDVAGRILLPSEDVRNLRHLAGQSFDVSLKEISRFAREINVSRRMVAYQLMRAHIIDHHMYNRLSERFHDDWLRSRSQSRTIRREESAVSYYVVRRHRLGPALVDLARRSLSAGTLTPTRAARLLGLKPTSVHPLLFPNPS